MVLGQMRWFEDDVEVSVIPKGYPNRRLAVVAHTLDGVPYGMVSINVPEIRLAKDEFILGHSDDRHLPVRVLSLPGIEDTGRWVDYGFIKGAPVFRVKDVPEELDRAPEDDLPSQDLLDLIDQILDDPFEDL